VALVVSNRADAGALERARAAGVPSEVVPPETFSSPEAFGERLLELLREHRIDLVVLAGFLRRIPATVVAAYLGRMVNIHPALLPRYGGPGMYGSRVHAAVLAAGERESGASVHFVDPEYDRGPVIAQARVPVLSSDTVDSLSRRVLEAEHRLLPQVVELIARGWVHLGPDGTVRVEEKAEPGERR
jgi:phosphoribosylglycinamide formyltransferase-1